MKKSAFIIILFCSSIMAIAQNDRQLLKETALLCASGSHEATELTTLRLGAERFGIQQLFDFSTMLENRELDVQNHKCIDATKALLEYASLKYGKESCEAICCRRSLVQIYAYVSYQEALSLANINVSYAQSLYEKDKKNASKNALRLVCELELMVLQAQSESENPLRWKELYELEREVLSYLNEDTSSSQEKTDICKYMASLKNTSSTFFTCVNYYFNKIFPKDLDIPMRKLNNIISNAEYYYQLAYKYQEGLTGPNHILTLTTKQALLDFKVQYGLIEYDEVYPQLDDIKQKLSVYVPIGDPLIVMADLSIWECRQVYYQDNPDISSYRFVLRNLETFYGKENVLYLNSLYRIMKLMTSHNIMMAERLRDEMLELAEKLFNNDVDIYGQYLYGAFSVSLYSSEPQHISDYAKRLIDFYQQNHHPSWGSAILGKDIADAVGEYLLSSNEEIAINKIALDDVRQVTESSSVEYAMWLDEYSRTLLYGDTLCYQEAIEVSRRVLDLYKKYDIPVAIPYSTLAKAYLGLGQTDLYEKALRQGVKEYQEHDLWRSYLSTFLAQKLFRDNKNLDEAHALLQDAETILYEQENMLFGDFYAIYNNLGDCYWAQGELKKAEKIFLRGKERHEQNEGQYDGNYSEMITNLFTLYIYDMNDFDKAEMIIKERIDAIKENPTFSLHNVTLDFLLNYLHVIEEKTPDDYMRITLVWQDIFKEINLLATNSVDNKTQVATIVKNVMLEMSSLFLWIGKLQTELSNTYASNTENMKQLEQYKALCKQEILPLYIDWEAEKRNSEKNYLNDWEYNEIATCLFLYYLNVESNPDQALNIIKPLINSENNAIRSNALHQMSLLYLQEEEWEIALKILEERKNLCYDGLSLSRKAELDRNLFSIYINMRQYDQAIQPSLDYYQHRKQMMQQNFDLLTQEEREAFIKEGGVGGDAIYFLLKQYPQKLNAVAYNCLLEEKGLQLRSSERIKKAIIKLNDASLNAQMDSLTKMTQLLKRKNTAKSKIDYEDEVVQLRLKIESLERSINRQASLHIEDMNTPNWKKLQSFLKQGEAAIEYVLSDSASCGALVLLPQGEPQYIFLTPSNELWKELNQLKDLDAQLKAETLYQDNKLHLYNKLWQPLENELRGVNVVYYSPTGFLNDLSFPAFKCTDGSYLSDHYELHQMLSTGDLVSIREHQDQTSITSASFYGDVYYSPEHEQLAKRISQGTANRGVAQDGRGAIIDEGEAFGYLSYTKQEIEQVNKIFKNHQATTSLLSGFAPTEESIRDISNNSPQVLHLSTHGFFINGDAKAMDNKFLARFPSTRFSSMQRSGLAFVDANHTWKGAIDKPEDSDGILTANEVALLDLSKTRLAVLSACQTAIGEYSIEGVYGMHRGFKQAGVKSILATLWNVNDKSTARLMELFYGRWLSGTPMQQSLNEAVKELRKEYPSPFYWAPFILMDAEN